MRLNPDCIRDILLTVEENTGYGTSMHYDDDTSYEYLESYTHDEVMYHIRQSEFSNLIIKVSYFIGGGCLINDLSPMGHEFLANIRSDTNWNKTKDIAKNVGSYSLDALSKIATSVITSMINSQLGL